MGTEDSSGELADLDAFKKNLQLIERVLTTAVGKDFLDNLEIAASWLRYAKDPALPEIKQSFIAREFVPTILKIILTRKYEVSEEEVQPMIQVVHLGVDLLLPRVGVDEVVGPVLEMVFNHNQPLFQKMYAFKGAKAPAIPSHAFIKSLTDGCCVDVLVDGQWHVAVVERFSEFRTEFEASLVAEGKSIWLSVEKDAYRMAPFGTKAGSIDNSLPSSVAEAIVSGSPGVPLQAIPRPGSLIDAQDALGVWYQACVLEISEQTVASPTSAPAHSPRLIECKSSGTVDDDVLDFTKDDESTVDLSVEPESASAPAPPLVVVFVRVAFLHQPSHLDVWIPFPSHRLAVLNSASGGRHGDIRIREEIVFLSVFHRDLSEPFGGNFARHYSNAFVCRPFVQLVDAFGEASGFKRVVQAVMDLIRKGSPDFVSRALPLINLIGQVHRVLNKPVLQEIIGYMVAACRKLIQSMGSQEIREVPVEALEASLGHIEAFVLDTYGRTPEAGDLVENLRLTTAIRYFSSSYLIRKLGGLKMLSDLLKRASNSDDFPGGIQRVIGASKDEFGLDSISLHVIPITLAWTRNRICTEMMKINLFGELFEGSDVHESIVARSAPILQAYAQEDMLDDNLLETVLKACVVKGTMVCQTVADSVFAFNASRLTDVLAFMVKLDSAAVNEGWVGIVHNIAWRCRSELLSRSAVVDKDVRHTYLPIHTECLQILWGWADDAATVDSAIKLKCLDQLEALIELGYSPVVGAESTPYANHLERLQPLLRTAINALRSCRNTLLAVRCLQAMLFSFPTKGYNIEYTRRRIAENIQQIYDLFESIASCVQHVKETSERAKYLEEANKLLDCFYNLFRSMEKTNLPTEVLTKIWDLLVVNAGDQDEFNLGMMLMSKIATKIESTEVLYGSPERWLDAYTRLICSLDYLSSPFFSLPTLRTVEKWFRTINSEMNGLIFDQKDGRIETIIAPLHELLGLTIFRNIVDLARLEEVATQAVAFVMSLVQQAGPKAEQFRANLLASCLTAIRCGSGAGHDHTAVLTAPAGDGLGYSAYSPRTLTMLNGLVEESFRTSPHRLIPHGMVSQSQKIVFKISSSSKSKVSFADITLRGNDTVQDLLDRVSQQAQLGAKEIKIFRLGKELKPEEAYKTLGQLPMMGVKESLVIAERPHAKASIVTSADGLAAGAGEAAVSDATNLAATSSAAAFHPTQPANVALDLATTPAQYSALMALLEASSSTEVAHIWKTISSLPTFRHILTRWEQLDCVHVEELTTAALSPHALGEIVYVLQVLTFLVDPSVSLESLHRQYDPTTASALQVDRSGWLQKFLAKSGLAFLSKCHFFIVALVQDYVHVQQTDAITAAVPQLTRMGADQELCLQGLGLVHTLLRVCVHSVYAPQSQYAVLYDAYRARLQGLILGQDKTLGEHPGGLLDADEQEQMLIGHQVDQKSLEGDWEDLYWHSWRSIALVHALMSRRDEKVSALSAVEGGGLRAGKEKDARHKTFLCVLEDALFLSTSIALLHPEILAVDTYGAKGVSESVEGLVAPLLPGATADKTFVNWLVGALLFFLNAVGPCSSQAMALRSKVLAFVLAKRPHIYSVRVATQSNALFRLAVGLIAPLSSVPPAAAPTFGTDKRRDLCRAIIAELQAANTLMRSSPDMDLELEHLDGTMLLLEAVLDTNDRLVTSCLDRGVVEFLLTDVLGIDSQRHRDSILAKEPSIRSHAYAVLGHILRNGALSLRIYTTLKDIHKTLVPLTTFDIHFEQELKHKSGYMGLRNLGSTCYMNSLLQALYMLPWLRNYLLTARLATQGEAGGSFLVQLQRVFKHMFFGQKKAFAPTAFMRIFHQEFHIQQDACEYFLLLSEKMEQSVLEYNNRIKEGEEKAEEKAVDVMKQAIGGLLVNQMYVRPDESHGDGGPASSSAVAGVMAAGDAIRRSIAVHGLREQEEAFNVLSLDVKDCTDMVSSLAKFVQTECISDFQWSESAPKVDIMKRQVISEARDVLVFHLKRFEMNFDTFVRAKVNSSFAFPMDLDIFPYTRQGLAFDRGAVDGSVDRAAFVYDLCGVIVHTGTSDSGHYFAYIKDVYHPNQAWIEFNDAEISNFDVQNLSKECFGGRTAIHEYIQASQSFVTTDAPNPKNAYLLFYHRRKAQITPPPPPTINHDDATASGDPGLQDICKANELFRREVRLLSPAHIGFYRHVVSALIEQAQRSSKCVAIGIISESMGFLWNYVTHTPCRKEMKELFDLLMNYITEHDQRFIAAMDKTENPVESVHGLALPPPPPPMDVQADSPSSLPSPPVPSESSSLPLMPPAPPAPAAAGPPVGPTALSTQCLRDLNSCFQDVVMSCLVSPHAADLRECVADMIVRLVRLAWEVERAALPTYMQAMQTASPSDIKMGALSLICTDSTPKVASEGGTMDADLALALRLSREVTAPLDPSPSTSASAPSGSAESVSVETNPLLVNPFLQKCGSEVIRFAFELTMDGRVGQLSASWRKHHALLSVLSALAQLDPFLCELLVARDMVAQCVDAVLGDQSPLSNRLYASTTSDRKRAPSSYLAAPIAHGPSLHQQQLLKNVPDWTDLLGLLNTLVRAGGLSDWDTGCVTCKTLFSTLIKQARYRGQLAQLVELVAKDNAAATAMVCEVLSDEMGMVSPEGVYVVFEVLHSFMSIPDTLTTQRVRTLFGVGSTGMGVGSVGGGGLLALGETLATQALKPFVVVTFIRSFLALFSAFALVLEDVLCRPSSAVSGWAGWMARFLAAHAPSTAAAPATPGAVGPTVEVYGEEAADRQLTWPQRFEKTQSLLAALLLTWDLDLATVAAAPSASTAMIVASPVPRSNPSVHFHGSVVAVDNSANSKKVGSDAPLQLSDGMTDEELARFLSSQCD